MQSSTDNPIADFVKRQGALVLDGGMATALEARGYDLDDDLWSAKILMEAPHAIRQVHLDFLAAGADCITTSTYQASVAGFGRRGLGDEEGVELLRLSVRLALDARDEFWGERDNRIGRLRPLVAAGIGPYGAFLADGSEYTGRYGIGDDELYAFHRSRWEVLAGSDVDLFACETIPSRQEAGVLLRLLRETPGCRAWMSFSCCDGTRLCDESPMVDVARECDSERRVVAIGVNCTSPQFISSLITETQKGTKKPIVVYPNSGERYDPVGKTWASAAQQLDWEEAVAEWAGLGAVCIGGCCRVGPPDIARIRAKLVA